MASILAVEDLEEPEENKEDVTCWYPGTPHDIELSVTVQHVGSIDQAAQTFLTRLWIDTWWLPSVAELASGEPTEWDVEKQLQMVTAVEIGAQEIKSGPKLKDIKGRTMFHASTEIVATCSAQFDMLAYPFDVQCLNIKLEMGNVNSMRYVAPRHLKACLSVETQLCPTVEFAFPHAGLSYTASDASLSKQGNRYAQAIIQVALERRWQPIVNRTLSLIALLTFGSLASFAIDSESPSDRLGFLYTIILTLVAFQLILAEKLPPSNRLTWFEIYMSSCFLVLFGIAGQAALVGTAVEGWGWENFDKNCFYISIGLTCLIHVIAVVSGVQTLARSKAEAYSGEEREHEKNVSVTCEADPDNWEQTFKTW